MKDDGITKIITIFLIVGSIILYVLSGEVFNILIPVGLIIAIIMNLSSSPDLNAWSIAAIAFSIFFYLFEHVELVFSDLGSYALMLMWLALLFNVATTLNRK